MQCKFADVHLWLSLFRRFAPFQRVKHVFHGGVKGCPSLLDPMLGWKMWVSFIVVCGTFSGLFQRETEENPQAALCISMRNKRVDVRCKLTFGQAAFWPS